MNNNEIKKSIDEIEKYRLLNDKDKEKIKYIKQAIQNLKQNPY